MRFIKIPKKNCNSIRFAILFPIGSINDPIGKFGMAHLVEHMTFKKVGEFTHNEIYDICERLGVKIDARTGKTFLSFQFACRKNVFGEVVQLLHAMLKEHNYSEEDLREEKSIIVAEMLQKEQTNMQVIFDNRWNNSAFINSILGTEETLSAISVNEVIQYKKDLIDLDYSIILVGNFDDSDIEFINSLFVKDVESTVPQNVSEEIKPVAQDDHLQFVSDRSGILDVYYSYHAIVESLNDPLCTYVLDNVLFRGDKAFITEHLREKLGYIYEIDSDFAAFKNEVNWIFKFTVHKNNLIQTLIHLEELLNTFILDERYFQYVKAFCCDNLPMLYDDMDYLCNATMGNFERLNQWLTPEEFAKKIQEVPLKQYNDFFKRISKNKKVYIFGKTSYRDRKVVRSLIQCSSK